MSQHIRTITTFCLDCLGKAIVFGLIGAVLFLPFGLLGFIFEGDPTGLMVITGFGGLVGILFGIGQVFIDRFSEQPASKQKPIGGRSLLAFYVGSLVPWLQVIELGQTILKKDYSKQKPGRGKRALIAAVGCMVVLGLFMLVAVKMTSAPLNGSALLALGMAGVGGAIAGALTDSR